MKSLKVSIFMGLLFVLLLGACKDNDLENYENELNQEVSNPILEKEDVELTLRFHNFNEPYVHRFSKMVDHVNDSTDVKVILDLKGLDGYDAILRKELSRSEMPHIVEITNDGSFLHEETKHLLDLTDFLEESGLSEQFFLLDEFTIDGRVYGLPVMLSTTHLFYNKEIIEELGGVPKTWDELIERMKEAKLAGYSPIVLDEFISSPFTLFEGVLQQTAGKEKLYDLMTGDAKWSDDEFIEAFKLMEKLKMVEVPLLDEEPVEMFLAEDTAFIYADAYMLNLTQFTDELAHMQGNIGVMSIPSVSGTKGHQTSVHGHASYGYVFNADVTEKEEQMIYQFIETFWEEDLMLDYFVEYDWLPPMRVESVTTDELLQKIIHLNNESEAFFSGIRGSIPYETGNWDAQMIYDKELRDVLNSFMYEGLSIQEAVEEFQMHHDELLREQELSNR